MAGVGTGLRAEAEAYGRKRRAEADLLVSLAQARGKELENEAYRSSRGSELESTWRIAAPIAGCTALICSCIACATAR